MESPSLMKLVVLLSAGITLLCSSSALGDNIPNYVLTGGGAFVSPSSVMPESIIFFNFTGPGGIMLSGISHGIGVCIGVSGGGICDPSTSTAPFDSGDNLGTNIKGLPVSLFSIGGININAIGLINLPMESSATTITITEPVIFSGTFGVCAFDQIQGGCATGDTLATFTVNGKGIGTFTFTFTPGPDNTGSWTLTGGGYSLISTPEPSGLILIGTGVIGLGWKLSRRKQTT